jgi:hypothetical protein
MKYVLTPSNREHIAVHFGKPVKSGSVFYQELFPDVDALLGVLENRKPCSIVYQSSLREAHTYDLSDIGACGTVGVGLKSAFAERELLRENRNGFLVEYAVVDELPSVALVTVICSREEGEYRLITLFPGAYAPAFPHEGMASEELRQATDFWKKNILLKRK